ncbi:phytanoyl-CoA dioxygenase family protein [Undibacterium terreum]|uniref:Phytanoyl-CoA dioxygenase n=1 Tax=Undibacterium terreum TaxID=1224302 RepID=A0A916XSC3_9BURK|nr:phytanoyl-CoA dioxygenase family protein [Undibacterium terreum]GGD01397.1 phytanoyl-CoA dioxygenase [Undibacterium terreum]
MLSPEQISEFQQQGYLILRGLAGPAFCEQVIAFAQQQLAEQVAPIEFEADLKYPGAPASRTDEGGHTARRLLRAYGRGELLANWATGNAIVPALKQLLGPQAKLSQAHHNCIMTKQPQYSSITGWHRDSRYWSFQRAELVTVWLALRDETVENGCLLVIPGSHKVAIQSQQLDDAQFLRPELEDNQALIRQAVSVPLQQGDVLFFSSNLFHAAGKNQTAQTKYSMVFTYRALDNPPVAGSRSDSLPEVAL